MSKDKGGVTLVDIHKEPEEIHLCPNGHVIAIVVSEDEVVTFCAIEGEPMCWVCGWRGRKGWKAG